MSVEAFVGLFRTSSRPSGYGAPAVWGAATASILMAGVGAVLTRRLIASVIGARDALPAVVATWLGTAALYYTARHAVVLACSLVVWRSVDALSHADCCDQSLPAVAMAGGRLAGWLHGRDQATRHVAPHHAALPDRFSIADPCKESRGTRPDRVGCWTVSGLPASRYRFASFV